MSKYIIRRILFAFPMILAITFIAFSLSMFIPSDPIDIVLRENNIPPSKETIESMRKEFGLDQPFLVRYVNWLKDAVQLDFGLTYTNRDRTVMGEITRSMPTTIKLAGFSFLIVVLVSFPVGLFSALYRNSIGDRIIRLLIFVGSSLPNYWVSLVLMWVFALKLKLLPTSGITSFENYILPSVALSLGFISMYIRLIRKSVLDNLQEDYIMYARARCLPKHIIIYKYLLKNSIQSCVTALGMSIVRLIAGTFIIESIFSLPGIGRLAITSIFNRDYPVIQAYILFMGILFIVVNLLVDILQVYLNPKLRDGVA